MRNFVSERALQIPPSGIRKFFDLALTMHDVISLGVGEPDFRTPWNICEAGIYSVEQGATSYTSNRGSSPSGTHLQYTLRTVTSSSTLRTMR